MSMPIFKAVNVTLRYYQKQSDSFLSVLSSVNIEIHPRQVIGLLGQSGSGKTSLARALIGMHTHYQGDIFWYGLNLKSLCTSDQKRFRQSVQYIFQDPFSSLNPKISAWAAVLEGMNACFPGIGKMERRERIEKIFSDVGLSLGDLHREIRQFSGGQRQRIAIARALMVNPDVLICDEIVSALDPSLKSQIMNVLYEIRQHMNVAILFISHDIPLVKMLGDKIYEIKEGAVIEQVS